MEENQKSNKNSDSIHQQERLNPQTLKPFDLVQLDPEVSKKKDSFFAACIAIVDKVKPWGAQVYVLCPQGRGLEPRRAYYRASWEEMVKVGKAEWTAE